MLYHTPHLDHRRGLMLALVGVAVLSFDSLLVRLAQTDAWTIVFWRGLFIALALGAACLSGRRIASLRASYPAAAASGVLSALGSSLFVAAVMHTQVANAVVILSAAPLCAAIYTRLFLREPVALRTWVAIVLAMTGMAVVFAGSIQGGGLLGDLFALGSAAAIGGNLTVLRRHPALDRVPLIALGGALSAIAALVFAQPLAVRGQSLLALAVMGLVQMPLALVLMNTATRYLPSAEVALFLLLESVLGTVWVWWLLGEAPPGATVAGGALIVATLGVHAWLGLRAQRMATTM